jgi:DNA-binding winged helix-turn-helix (wHTH) protein/tetratricopeptide (TPR) repeat protein
MDRAARLSSVCGSVARGFMHQTNPLQLRFDAFELDEADARLTRSGQPVALPPKAFAVLCTLARQPGQLVTKDALLDAVWGHRHVSESVLKTMISALRTALSDDAKQPRYIETAARRGYRFVGAPRATSAPDVASVLHDTELIVEHVPAPAMIGRRAARDRLRMAWHNAIAGRRQIFWVAGEAGVGKTTLIDNFVADLEAVTCARGQCVEQYGAGEPYLPVFEALGALCRNDPALAPMMRAVAPTWLLQLPWLSSEAEREMLRRELAGSSQDRMMRELGELLDRYTQQRPVLLVTEDLHWSDHATTHLIDHIARRRSAARLMWLASFRLAEVISEDHPLKGLRHELKLHRLCDELVLDSFSEREVADYVDSRLPDAELSEHFVRVLHTHTDGLPLFVVNVVDDLISQCALEFSSAEPLADTDLQVPENLAGVIEKQIARLPAELRDLLEAASVCGVEFRPGSVADALERDAGWVGEHCDALVRRQQWLRHLSVGRLPDGSFDARYAFRHALYRHVFYQRIGALMRAQLHGRVALSMERSRASGMSVTSAELASHFELSHNLMAALRHYAAAAENALKRFAPTEVVTLTTHALALLPRCPESIERHALELALIAPRAAACSQLMGVTSPEAASAFERAHVLYDLLPATPTRAAELGGMGWVFFARGEFDQACALATRIHALAESCDDRVLQVSACNLMGNTLTYQGELLSGKQWLERGLTVGAELTAYPAFVVDFGVSMHARLGQNLAHLGFVDQARGQIDAALARADALAQPFAQAVALNFAAMVEARLGDPKRMLEQANDLDRKVTSHALGQGAGPARWLRGYAIARLGEPDAGHALIVDGLERNVSQGMVAGNTAVMGYAAEALILAGRWPEAQKHLEDALALAQRIRERLFLPDLLLLEARVALGQNQLDAARIAMEAALAEARAQQALWLELSALVALCELDDAAAEHRAALGHACKRVSEGFDTDLVKRACELVSAARTVEAPRR